MLGCERDGSYSRRVPAQYADFLATAQGHEVPPFPAAQSALSPRGGDGLQRFQRWWNAALADALARGPDVRRVEPLFSYEAFVPDSKKRERCANTWQGLSAHWHSTDVATQDPW